MRVSLSKTQQDVLKQIVRNGDVPDLPHVRDSIATLARFGFITITEETTPRIRPTDLGREAGGRQHG